MKIEIDLKEDIDNALERFNGTIVNDLEWRIRTSIVDKVSADILKQIVEKDHWDKEKLINDISDKVNKKIDEHIRKIADERVKAYNLQGIVNSKVNTAIREMVENKIASVMSNLILIDQSEQQEEVN